MERIALDLEGVEESLASSFNTGAEDFNAPDSTIICCRWQAFARAIMFIDCCNAGTSVETSAY